MLLVRAQYSKALWCFIAALFVLFCGCGPSTQFYRDVDIYTAEGKYDMAVEEVRKNEKAYGDKSTVLYKLDLGALYHYAGETDSSNKYLFAAEKEIEDLYTESISLKVLSFILNDNVIPYDGEDFEKVLVNVFLALNYAAKGMDEDALVEARKVDLKLKEYSRQYDGKNKYQEDAFIRYIAGVLYENEGEINDAFISYKKSYETYLTYEKEYGTKAPSFLFDDLVRTAKQLSFDDEAEKFKDLGGRLPSNDKRMGSVLVVTYTGKGPIKIEQRPTVSIPDSSGTLHTFQIALPKFVPRMSISRVYDVAAVSGGDTIVAGTTLAEDINAIAQKALEDRLGLIYLKSGGRALAKFLFAEKTKKDINKDDDSKVKNFLASLAIDLVVGATEQADTRTWRTLPAEIQIARLNLSPGQYTVSVISSDDAYRLKNVDVNVRPGRTSFVIVDDLR
ncbi:MAG: hypothetical protein HW412_2185 [Bacteroidetes bacterium]|nr:hypothetical protein [Bacteroidota bacterium]